MKKSAEKILALCLAFICVLSTMPLNVFASAKGEVASFDTNGDGKVSYVSLGDSMTNGYGLKGYEYEYHVGDETQTECTDVRCELEHEIFHWSNGYKQVAPCSYPDFLATHFGWELTQMAMSAMRIEDLRWVLEYDLQDNDQVEYIEAKSKGQSYNSWLDENGLDGSAANWEAYQASGVGYSLKEWNSLFRCGDYYTWNEFISGRFNSVYPGATPNKIANEYQVAVKNAEVITLGSGNANFGVFMLNRIMEAISFNGTPDKAMIYEIDAAINGLSPAKQETIRTLKNALSVALYKGLGFAGLEANPTIEALINTIVYTCVSYSISYEGTLEAILKKNPDVKIVILGLMNTLDGINLEIEGVEQLKKLEMADIMDIIIGPMNEYLASLPTRKQFFGNDAYKNATFYYAEAESVECLVNDYRGELENGNETIRERFITSIVGSSNDSKGMVWDLLAPAFDSMLAESGLALEHITRRDVEEYLNFVQDWNEYVSSGKVGAEPITTLTSNQIISCGVYLAFEEAIVEATDLPAISTSAFGKLASGVGDVFSGIQEAMVANGFDIEAISADVMEMVYESIVGRDYIEIAKKSSLFDAKYDEVLGRLNDGFELVENPDVTKEEYLKKYVIGQDEFSDITGGYETYANDFNGGLPEFTFEEAAEVVALCYVVAEDTEEFEKAVAEYVNEQGYVTNYAARFTAASITHPLAVSLDQDPTIKGLLHLFARLLIGDGLGTHPSIDGHLAMFETIAKSIDENYLVQDQVVANTKNSIANFFKAIWNAIVYVFRAIFTPVK